VKHATCTVHACARKHHANGMCLVHYTHHRSDTLSCPVPGCTNRIGCMRYCAKHQRNVKLFGTPDAPPLHGPGRPCGYCSTLMAFGRSTHCGAEPCRLAYNAKRMRELNVKVRERTGTSLFAQHNRKYGGNHRQRARHHGVAYEPINRMTVFERDRWTCQLCLEPVDRTLKFPHPLSPSIDHVRPMAKGGGHVLANVQCTHFICNSRKSDGSHLGQLSLEV